MADEQKGESKVNNSILQRIDQIDRQIAELRMAVKEEQVKEHTTPIQNPNAIPVMLTIAQAADKTGLSYDFVRTLCLQKKIVFIKAGSKYLINQEKLVDFLNKGMAAGQEDGRDA